jgi:hypothetical protein
VGNWACFNWAYNMLLFQSGFLKELVQDFSSYSLVKLSRTAKQARGLMAFKGHVLFSGLHLKSKSLYKIHKSLSKNQIPLFCL